MYCPNYKQEFTSKFCPDCGTKLVEKTQRVCPNCNIEVESKFCRMAAEQGHAEAQYQMGFFYDCGIGIRSDKDEALKWYSKAAEQGYADAIEELKKLE